MDDRQITIRPLEREELDAWWEMRLIALRDHPDAFGSSFEWAKAQGPAYLVDRDFRDSSGLNRIFVAFDTDGAMLATAGVFRNSGKRSHIAVIWGVFTRQERRGQGLSKRIIATAIDHCRAFPGIRQVHISVNANNAPALHMYEAAGFVVWGREPLALPDGDYDELHMAILLDTEEGWRGSASC